MTDGRVLNYLRSIATCPRDGTVLGQQCRLSEDSTRWECPDCRGVFHPGEVFSA